MEGAGAGTAARLPEMSCEAQSEVSGKQGRHKGAATHGEVWVKVWGGEGLRSRTHHAHRPPLRPPLSIYKQEGIHARTRHRKSAGCCSCLTSDTLHCKRLLLLSRLDVSLVCPQPQHPLVCPPQHHLSCPPQHHLVCPPQPQLSLVYLEHQHMERSV